MKSIEKRFGMIAVGKGYISLEQLLIAMKKQISEDVNQLPHRLIGDIMIEMGFLKPGQIKEILEKIEEIAPGWMLNHRKDIDTGKDIHLISSDVDLRLRDDINLLKMIRSYRGVRHESGLSVRGQRTRANNRKGLALGVSKKREQ